MSNVMLPILGRSRLGMPYWLADQLSAGHNLTLSSDASFYEFKDNDMRVIGSSSPSKDYIPIVRGFSEDDIEVLFEFSRLTRSSGTFTNTGGGIFFSNSLSTDAYHGYELSLGTVNNTSLSLYDINEEGSSLIRTVTVDSEISELDVAISLRFRREIGVVKAKVWLSKNIEPTSWDIVESSNTYIVDSAGICVFGRGLNISVNRLSYATNGDTASFVGESLSAVYSGVIESYSPYNIVSICDVNTHDILDIVRPNNQGSWICYRYDDKPVYARIDTINSSYYDMLFAKSGTKIIGGEFPSSSIKDNGEPSTGEVSLLYRSENPILGGGLIERVVAAPSGEWAIKGLVSDVLFDVVARKPNRKDAIVSSVTAAIDPESSFVLMNGLSGFNGYVSGMVLTRGATLPITAKFTGQTPYGFSDDDITIDNDKVIVGSTIRDYGDLSFNLTVTDANSSVTKAITLPDCARIDFVDFVASENSPDRNSGSSPIELTIPSNINDGDILVLAVMRRGNVSVSDSNSGLWLLGGDVFSSNTSYPQGTSIYYRTAKAGDAGSLITVKGPYSGRLIAYLSAYRGKFSPLEVVSTHTSPVRFDTTYKDTVKNLAPIIHSSGFIIRAVSNVYTSPSGTTIGRIKGMVNTGPTSQPVSNAIRMQVAYKHLSRAGILDGITYEVSASDVDDSIADVAIVLDEVRP